MSFSWSVLVGFFRIYKSQAQLGQESGWWDSTTELLRDYNKSLSRTPMNQAVQGNVTLLGFSSFEVSRYWCWNMTPGFEVLVVHSWVLWTNFLPLNSSWILSSCQCEVQEKRKNRSVQRRDRNPSENLSLKACFRSRMIPYGFLSYFWLFILHENCCLTICFKSKISRPYIPYTGQFGLGG